MTTLKHGILPKHWTGADIMAALNYKPKAQTRYLPLALFESKPPTGLCIAAFVMTDSQRATVRYERK